MTEAELHETLLRLADCRFEPEDWKSWWSAHAAEVKPLVSPGDFSRLNCAPSLYGPASCMEKCQRGAERYLAKKRLPFHHGSRYGDEAAEERRRYHRQKDLESAVQREDIRARQERDRRDPEALPYYKALVDWFVKFAETPSQTQRRITETGFPSRAAKRHQDLWKTLSPGQRQTAAQWLQAEREEAVGGILAQLDWLITCDELELHQHGLKLPYMTFDDLLHDFTARIEGEPWPDEGEDN